MRRFITALALTCALSTSVWAGEIPTVGITSNTPGATAVSPGEIPTSGCKISNVALNLIEIMFAAGV